MAERPVDTRREKKLRVRESEALLEGEWPEMLWLVDGLIPRTGHGFLAGLPKSGKTWLGISLMLCALSGRPWCGRRVRKLERSAVYIAGEGSMPSLSRRIRSLANGYNIPHSELQGKFCLLHQPDILLNEKDDFKMIAEEIMSRQPGLVIFDSLTRLHTCDENNRTELEQHVLSPLMKLANYLKCCMVVIHHSKDPMKSGKTTHFDPLRGSQALRGWHEFLLWVEPDATHKALLKGELRDAPAPRPCKIQLVTSNNDTPQMTARLEVEEIPEDDILVRNVEQDIAEEEEDKRRLPTEQVNGREAKKEILELLAKEPLSIKALHKKTSRRKSTIQDALDDLIEMKLVAADRSGEWTRYLLVPQTMPVYAAPPDPPAQSIDSLCSVEYSDEPEDETEYTFDPDEYEN